MTALHTLMALTLVLVSTPLSQQLPLSSRSPDTERVQCVANTTVTLTCPLQPSISGGYWMMGGTLLTPDIAKERNISIKNSEKETRLTSPRRPHLNGTMMEYMRAKTIVCKIPLEVLHHTTSKQVLQVSLLLAEVALIACQPHTALPSMEMVQRRQEEEEKGSHRHPNTRTQLGGEGDSRTTRKNEKRTQPLSSLFCQA